MFLEEKGGRRVGQNDVWEDASGFEGTARGPGAKEWVASRKNKREGNKSSTKASKKEGRPQLGRTIKLTPWFLLSEIYHRLPTYRTIRIQILVF